VEHKSAVVLAMFGTTVEEALPGLLNIRAKMVEHCPGTPVRITFTSKIIRRIWRERAGDSDYRASRPELPEEFFRIQGPLATIAGLHDAGCAALVIQPVHMAPAEEYQDLRSSVKALAASSRLAALPWGPAVRRTLLAQNSRRRPGHWPRTRNWPGCTRRPCSIWATAARVLLRGRSTSVLPRPCTVSTPRC
jgi:sirohydrochlorin cobaltochelatase